MEPIHRKVHEIRSKQIDEELEPLCQVPVNKNSHVLGSLYFHAICYLLPETYLLYQLSLC